jgi:hypothetical protein
MRASGSNIAAHPVKQEIERVKAYMARVSKLSEPKFVDEPSVRVDKEAAHRIVSHTVGSKRSSTLT